VKTELGDHSSPTDSLSTSNERTKNIEEEIRAFFTKYVPKYAPYTAFLLIPIFALLLAWFFRRQKLFYMFHLVFALHFHTFLWIFCSILLIIDIFTHKFEYPDWLSFILFLIPGAYLTIGFHHFYHTKSWWKTVLKAIGITLLYVLLIIIVTILLIISVMLIFFPEIIH
jgi:hypothetical protein